MGQILISNSIAGITNRRDHTIPIQIALNINSTAGWCMLQCIFNQVAQRLTDAGCIHLDGG